MLAVAARATAATAQHHPPGDTLSTAPAASAVPERPRLRAVRAASPVRLDGRLDEADWAAAPAFGAFRQVEPTTGARARFASTVRVLFDRRALYVGLTMRDSAGAAGRRVQDLRRDFDYFQNDLVGVSLDPFLDRRNAQAFQVNPGGALRDLLVRDGTDFNRE